MAAALPVAQDGILRPDRRAGFFTCTGENGISPSFIGEGKFPYLPEPAMPKAIPRQVHAHPLAELPEVVP